MKTLKTQDSRPKIQDSRLKAQDPRFKIEDRRPKRRHKIKISRFEEQDSRRLKVKKIFKTPQVILYTVVCIRFL
jgi:hypothetical protein